ncbi:hypothetical protein [Candidatus Magnetominusculus dajiuhuensis]|uniref:hypothetical protein n=1 Tax=Candidatus Magnetominusculus dajiuhuensis TaxID=3137712 RepID=UPI003B42FBA5
MPVKIEIPFSMETFMMQNEIVIPPAITGWGLIDTGATITAVDDAIIKSLGLFR